MDAVRRFFDGDIFFSFKRSPLVIVAAAIVLVYVLSALFAPWVAPHNPFDLRTLNLLDAFTPPAWIERGNPTYLLGTDDQGRDVISAIIFDRAARPDSSRPADWPLVPAGTTAAARCVRPSSLRTSARIASSLAS